MGLELTYYVVAVVVLPAWGMGPEPQTVQPLSPEGMELHASDLGRRARRDTVLHQGAGGVPSHELGGLGDGHQAGVSMDRPSQLHQEGPENRTGAPPL